jgi:hypothetical protein
LFGHSKLPDHEGAWCLPGGLRRDRIGRAHNHLPTTGHGEACHHSDADVESQEACDAAAEFVSIVTCGDPMRIMVRVRRDWREWKPIAAARAER